MVIVTGAAGFIGSCLLARLNAKGITEIIIVDHLDNGFKKENLRHKKFSQYHDKKDFLNLVAKGKVSPAVDTVIHMGACSSTTLQDRNYFLSNNYKYSCRLADWCFKNSVRFIYASSAATYGDGKNGYRDDIKTIRACLPLNYYGESKQKFDEWILDNQFLERCVGLKFFNVFGPNEYHKGEMQSVIAKAYPNVAKEGKMRLFKSYRKDYAHGEQKRDFIYVKDAIDVVMYFFEHADINGIYNVGTGKARSWNDVARALFDAVGKSSHIEYIDMPEYMRPRYQYFTQADMTKLRSVGFTQPFSELEDAAKDYVTYLKGHTYI